MKVTGFLALPTGDGVTDPLHASGDRLLRYNDATGHLEYHDGTAWHPVAEVDTTGLQLFAGGGLHMLDDTLYLGGTMTDSTDLEMQGDYLALRQVGNGIRGLYFLKATESGDEAIRLQADGADGALNRLDLLQGA